MTLEDAAYPFPAEVQVSLWREAKRDGGIQVWAEGWNREVWMETKAVERGRKGWRKADAIV